MSSIYITQGGGKEILIGGNLQRGIANRAYEIGLTAVRKKIFSTKLDSRIKLDATDNELLLNFLDKQPNVLLLYSNDTWIELIDVKINVTRKNTIVSTAMVGARGTVKEFINARDYSVKINGNLHNLTEDRLADLRNGNIYPIVELAELNNILSQLEVFSVANVFLNTLGIDKLVLDAVNYDQHKQKYFNILPFTIDFISDEDNYFLVEPYLS